MIVVRVRVLQGFIASRAIWVANRGKVQIAQGVTGPSDLLPKGATVSIEVKQPAVKAVADVKSVDVGAVDSNGSNGLIGTIISSEAVLFARERCVLVELSQAIDIARASFSIVGDPVVEVVHDCEMADASYLSIEIQVSGSVTGIVMAHRGFAQEAARVVGDKREMITLHYDII